VITPSRLIAFLRRGPRHVATRLYYVMRAPKARCFPLVAESMKGHGLEIGGPSPIFAKRGLLPVYPWIGALDNCNFGRETVWEGQLREGPYFRFGRRIGSQFVSEAFDLKVPDAAYDFVMSSHMLEHSANPVRVLVEWFRVLKPAGHLLLVLPEARRTWDRHRPVTRLTHLLDDFRRLTPESDRSHFDEIAALHAMPSEREGVRKSLETNESHRMAHHHVFDLTLAVDMTRHVGFEILAQELEYPCHIIVFAR